MGNIIGKILAVLVATAPAFTEARADTATPRIPILLGKLDGINDSADQMKYFTCTAYETSGSRCIGLPLIFIGVGMKLLDRDRVATDPGAKAASLLA